MTPEVTLYRWLSVSDRAERTCVPSTSYDTHIAEGRDYKRTDAIVVDMKDVEESNSVQLVQTLRFYTKTGRKDIELPMVILNLKTTPDKIETVEEEDEAEQGNPLNTAFYGGSIGTNRHFNPFGATSTPSVLNSLGKRVSAERPDFLSPALHNVKTARFDSPGSNLAGMTAVPPEVPGAPKKKTSMGDFMRRVSLPTQPVLGEEEEEAIRKKTQGRDIFASVPLPFPSGPFAEVKPMPMAGTNFGHWSTSAGGNRDFVAKAARKPLPPPKSIMKAPSIAKEEEEDSAQQEKPE